MTYILIVILLLASGLFSGLNLGLMSLEPNELKRKAKLGNKSAEKIYPIRQKGNQLLVTIILCNVALNSVLAIYLGSITAGVIAAILATGLITLFGEILPQSVISRHALKFGAWFAWFIKIVMTVLSPICKPIAILLDKTLGEELPTVYSKKELIEILEEHGESKSSVIRKDEERIASGALSFGTRSVNQVMTPRSVVIGVKTTDVVDDTLINKLIKHGYSRVPVSNDSGENILGILFLFNLINSDFKNKKVSELFTSGINTVQENELLDQAFNMFIKTRQKLFAVVNEFSEYVGIITLEDIVEDIIGQEIVDEFDEHVDMRKVASDQARLE